MGERGKETTGGGGFEERDSGGSRGDPGVQRNHPFARVTTKVSLTS